MSEIMNNGMNEIGSNGIKGNGTEEKKYRIADRKKCNMSGTAVMKSWKVLHG